MRRWSQLLTTGIIAAAIVAVVVLGLGTLRDRERIASLELRIGALEKQRSLRLTESLASQNQGLPLERDGFGPVRTIPLR
jgi:hypothetical protein